LQYLVQPRGLSRVVVHRQHPIKNVWRYLRSDWLSNSVFENYDAIIDAACETWRKLTAQPETITSIGMRQWAHVDQES
jgi:hypothetical protein